jgi:hypothetical protein
MGLMRVYVFGLKSSVSEGKFARFTFSRGWAHLAYKEAAQLGFNVTFLDHSSTLWKKLWLLRSMYQYDCPIGGFAKLFESSKFSTGTAVPAPPKP